MLYYIFFYYDNYVVERHSKNDYKNICMSRWGGFVIICSLYY